MHDFFLGADDSAVNKRQNPFIYEGFLLLVLGKVSVRAFISLASLKVTSPSPPFQETSYPERERKEAPGVGQVFFFKILRKISSTSLVIYPIACKDL